MSAAHLHTPEVIERQTIKRKNKLTLKQRKFAEEYVKTGNGTKAIIAAHPNVTSENSAGQMASENLTKPKIKAEIQRLLAENDVHLNEIVSVHKRNMLQDENYPTSQKAVGDFYEILGMKNTEKPTNDVKIAFVIEK